ncbi:hypothetical protein J7M22_00375 [Candidatus Poribacteria bacterium]|nr:hypothetical protein [Candidatus Poribacteria bacterium]
MAKLSREEKRLEKLLRKRMLAEQRAELRRRKVYIPQMNYPGSRALAAVLRSAGIDADVSPDDTRKAIDLAGRYLSGDECLPEKITLGGLLKVLMEEGVDPGKVAFFMPTAGGPCRFGQYRVLVKKILDDLGYRDVLIVSPSSKDGYRGIAEASTELIRTAWWAVVASDTLMKMLHRTRPYEVNKGDTDEVFERGTELICKVLEQRIPLKEKFNLLRQTMEQIRDEFRAIPAIYDPERPLIGVVGEIFCRMNVLSNEDLIRKVEELGGECWLSDVSEWIWYTNRETIKRIIDAGKRFSVDMIIEKIKARIQRRDEHLLLEPFKEDLRGYEEPDDINVILEAGLPYLPVDGALGEMVLSVGKAVYLYRKGADGIIDISPFTCMNGIASEAVYPHLSRDHDNIPIKNFYFDGTLTDLERDLSIFLELARNYQKRKKVKRVYPKCFGVS